MNANTSAEQSNEKPGVAALILRGLLQVIVLLPILAACIFVVRTALEDRMLQEELEGYQDYVQRVSYRLLPGVW